MKPTKIGTQDPGLRPTVRAFLDRHRHKPIMVCLDGSTPFLVILMRDDQHQMWQAGLHENFHTHQVVSIELSQPYPTLHIVVTTLEVE